ncbi:MAG: EAL domain-containing protein [Sulfuricurvum sp.]|uniref:putative bifunctional diguanylate cyclase/phosphodiesterase n=1 Tax=Sulfuricurvum sp. TaxID=2025608 RepID=UPI0026229877|nr:GGDEF domain-containing phosphodiesterase [Sulfuricurvum sp.]MDD5118092.1 EAL domain-containing protein [Sulfuricurvum sp.]
MDKKSGCLSLETLEEDKMHERRREFEILAMAMEHASDSMIVTDRNNNIIKVNNSFLKTFGYSEQDVIGKNTNFLSSAKHDPAFYNQMWNTLLKEKHWSSEIWNRRKNGAIFPAWVSISAIMDENNKIQNYLAIFTDLSALRESQEKTLKLAYYDQLTGLPNRQKIVSDMEKRNPVVCVIFNIDDFKEINDFYGIETGDNILNQVGQWFCKMNFFPYRISGDEFAVLLYEHFTWSDLRNRIAALMSLLEEKVFFIKNETINIRMTVGAAIGHGKLLTRADIALNRAKKNKLSVALYAEHENIEETYRSNMKMRTAIRSALGKHRIICHYQPIINLITGNIDKYETLVRMIDNDGTIVPPSKFLTIAKKTKLYPQITLEVLNQSCSLFSKRCEEFSINLSDSDIRDPFIVKEIIHTITQTGTASRIVFEILESEGIENYEEVVEFITSVKALGAKIAIDDFGTGYSNFENILKLNVDYIKIDGSLIQGITENSRHHIVVETIVDFAHKIGAKTIAEFVSSEEIYTAVKDLGVDFAQGYFTGKPEAIVSSF